MKLNPKRSSIPQQISEEELIRAMDYVCALNRPVPPSPESVARAQFIDRTFRWSPK